LREQATQQINQGGAAQVMPQTTMPQQVQPQGNFQPNAQGRNFPQNQQQRRDARQGGRQQR
jgi:hypothetical protein